MVFFLVNSSTWRWPEAPKHVVDIYVINIYLPQISCVRQLIKPNILFQHVLNDRQLHGLPHWSYTADLISKPLSTPKKKGGLRGLGPPCGVERRKNFPAILLILLNRLHSQNSSVGQCAIMLQDELSLPWTSVTYSTMKLLECLKVTSSMDISCCGKNWPICILQHPKRQSLWS